MAEDNLIPELTSSDDHLFLTNPQTNKGPAPAYIKYFVDSIEHEVLLFTHGDSDILDKNLEQPKFSPLIDFIPKWRVSFKSYFSKTQKWKGQIIEIKKNTFLAKLDDLTAGGTYETAEFDRDEITDDDLEFLKLGAVFYWSVGYSVRNGSVSKESVVRFQRLPAWTEDEENSVLDSINDLNNDIIWE
jgi:hypothetical protein